MDEYVLKNLHYINSTWGPRFEAVLKAQPFTSASVYQSQTPLSCLQGHCFMRRQSRAHYDVVLETPEWEAKTTGTEGAELRPRQAHEGAPYRSARAGRRPGNAAVFPTSPQAFQEARSFSTWCQTFPNTQNWTVFNQTKSQLIKSIIVSQIKWI